MKMRYTIGFVLGGLAAIGGMASEAQAALTSTDCTVSSVGWRENIFALRVVCGSNTFFNRESVGNPSCSLKTSMEAVKMFQTTAHASLLAGRSVKIWYDTQSGCSADLVIREMFLN
jgi:hypothetical protein